MGKQKNGIPQGKEKANPNQTGEKKKKKALHQNFRIGGWKTTRTPTFANGGTIIDNDRWEMIARL